MPWFAFLYLQHPLSHWVPRLSPLESLIEGAAAKKLHEICVWKTVEAPNEIGAQGISLEQIEYTTLITST